MKKIFAGALCVMLTSIVLTACSYEGSSTTESNLNAESSTTQEPKETSAVQQPTDNIAPSEISTEEMSVTADPKADEDVIIPLFPAEINDQVHTLAPEDMLGNSTYISLFKAYDSGKGIDAPTAELGMTKIPLYTSEYLNRTFVVNSPEQDGASITLTALYFDGAIEGLQDNDTLTISGFRGVTDSEEEANIYGFLPLYYNQSKKCFFGYGKKAAQYILCEIYFDGTEGNHFTRQPVEDASIYGF